MKPKDINARFREGTLPDDPAEGGTVMSDDVPRIWNSDEGMELAIADALDTSPREFCSFCHPDIDEAIGGAMAGEVTFLAADSSWGKSSWGLMVADEAAKRGKSVLVVSSEDSKEIFFKRLLRRRAQLSATDLRHRRLGKDDLQRIADVASKSMSKPYFLDARAHSVEWLAPRLKKAIVDLGIDLVICDYVGTFSKEKTLTDQSQRGAIQYIARTLVDICKTCKPKGVAGIILSQITSDERQPIPGKYAVRDSKDLVHMAENVLIGFIAPSELKDSYNNVIALTGDRCLKVAKAKEGIAGKTLVVLPWNERSACFEAVREGAREPAPTDNWKGGWDNER